MSDPTVVALVYQLEYGSSVDYSRARPLRHDERGFQVTIKDEKARFEFKHHYVTEQAARQAIDGYIRGWEVSVGLRHGPNRFRLRYLHPEIRDRNPPPGVAQVRGHIVSGVPQVRGAVVAAPPTYPRPPPSELEITPDVERMYSRYMDYLEGREPLPAVAYFCLTVLEDSCKGASKGKRRAAAREYQVSLSVLQKIGELSSDYGGAQARKAKGKDQELTAQQRLFLKEAIAAIINRAAHKSHSTMPKITRSDFPQL